jgi:hypothetical protein
MAKEMFHLLKVARRSCSCGDSFRSTEKAAPEGMIGLFVWLRLIID